MAKIFHLRNAQIAILRKRKSVLLANLAVPVDVVHASYVRQYLTCGKTNCRCRRGHKHGPFHYLVQCLNRGKVQKFLLKSAGQKEQARVAISAYFELQKKLQELSQINTELLRRGESLSA
jgi:hypothetical protein